MRRSGRSLPVFAVVGSVSEDLGDYRENFADVLVASDAATMRQAGADIAVVVNPLSDGGRLPDAGMLQS